MQDNVQTIVIAHAYKRKARDIEYVTFQQKSASILTVSKLARNSESQLWLRQHKRNSLGISNLDATRLRMENVDVRD